MGCTTQLALEADHGRQVHTAAVERNAVDRRQTHAEPVATRDISGSHCQSQLPSINPAYKGLFESWEVLFRCHTRRSKEV